MEDFGLSLRNARALSHTLRKMVMDGYMDTEEHGSEPATRDGWRVFGDLPRSTYSQDLAWRDRFSTPRRISSSTSTTGTCPSLDVSPRRRRCGWR